MENEASNWKYLYPTLSHLDNDSQKQMMLTNNGNHINPILKS